jgi:hypothetical protein
MPAPSTQPPSSRVEALLKKVRASRGRLIFALDATASREATWDMAAQLQAAMFEEAATIGGLDVQLTYFRGADEVRHSSWFSDAHELVGRMNAIRCMAGATKIARVLRHIRTENEREKVSAAIFIGDACEEAPSELYDVAVGLGVPLFTFQEADNDVILLNQYGEFVSEHRRRKSNKSFASSRGSPMAPMRGSTPALPLGFASCCGRSLRLRSEGLRRSLTSVPTARAGCSAK